MRAADSVDSGTARCAASSFPPLFPSRWPPRPGPPTARQRSPPAAATEAAKPAPLSELVEQVDIPYQTLHPANGLTVLVHTDRKTPVVGRHDLLPGRLEERAARARPALPTCYEHLLFGGSENVPNFDIPLEAAGSTSTNGSTWYDRTNYVETVPTGALDLALFMESDRMGHLLGAVTQDKLDKQRGVVQNEKRQGDNQPYGLAEYLIGDAPVPRRPPLSPLDDRLDGRPRRGDARPTCATGSPTTTRPNNVVLALAGDIDVATARPMVEKWFGDIPRGPEVTRTGRAGPVTLARARSGEMITDQVPVTRIYQASGAARR